MLKVFGKFCFSNESLVLKIIVFLKHHILVQLKMNSVFQKIKTNFLFPGIDPSGILTFWMSVNVISKVPMTASSFWAPSNSTAVCCSLLGCRNKAKLPCPPRRKSPSCSLTVSPSLGPCPSEETVSQISPHAHPSTGHPCDTTVHLGEVTCRDFV